MRNLRLYKTDIEFKTYEELCGGDGLSTKSIVPGVSMSNDIKKRYFNPKDEVVLFHEITINYKDKPGNTLAPSTTKRVKYISGVTSEIVLTPKNVEGFEAREVLKTVQIPEDTVVDFVYDKKKDYSQPLTFEILSDGKLNFKCNSYPYDKVLEYSKDSGKTWSSFTVTFEVTSIDVFSGETVFLRGNNSKLNSLSLGRDGTTCQFNLKGNIMSLIRSTGFDKLKELSGISFNSLFAGCSCLISTENLLLPATALTDYCYQYMFTGCTNLTSAPSILPATTLADRCYYSMFSGCTSLTQAPELPATTLAERCYYGMFQGCTSLTEAPELPATTLANGCYYSMFYGCTSLTEAPELPATTLAERCYQSMFQGCTSLTQAPSLPAETLTNYCYSNMFQGCTNLNHMEAMFEELPNTSSTYYWVVGVQTISGTFIKNANAIWHVVGSSGVPENWNILKNISFGRDIVSVSAQTQPVTLSINSISPWTATTIPSWLSLSQNKGGSGNTTITITQSSFEEGRDGKIIFKIKGYRDVPLLFRQLDYYHRIPLTFEITKSGNISWTYGNIVGGESRIIEYSKDGGETWATIDASVRRATIPVLSGETIQFRGNNETYTVNSSTHASFSASTCEFCAYGNIMSLIDGVNYTERTQLKEKNTFHSLFYNCPKLTSVQNLILPADILEQNCYYSMFAGCTSLTQAPELPATTLTQSCYAGMFRDCTSITQAPELPATALTDYCYQNMFQGCTRLNYIKCLATNISASSCLSNWVSGVQTTSGTFVKAASMTGWPTGVDGIPTNWTVQDAS